MEDPDWITTYCSTSDDAPWLTLNYWDLIVKAWKPLGLYPPECEITGRVKVVGEL